MATAFLGGFGLLGFPELATSFLAALRPNRTFYVFQNIFPVFQTGHVLCCRRNSFLCFNQDLPSAPHRISLVFQTGHFVCCEQEGISFFAYKTFPVMQTGHFLCGTQDITRVPSRMHSVFQSGHFIFQTGYSLCSKRGISCFPIAKNPHAICF